MEDLDDDEAVAAIAEAVMDRIDGPTRLSDIVTDIRQGGDIAARLLDDVTLVTGGVGEGLDEFVRDALWDQDGVWITHDDDPWLALSDSLMADVVFTHRLTRDEIGAGEVLLVPDLVALDYRADDELTFRGVEPLWVVRLAEPAKPGEDSCAIHGPDGWLAGFEPGDLVAFHRKGRAVDVERVTDLAAEHEIVAALKNAADQRIPAGHSEEAFPLVLDAMTTTPHAFRSAVRPLDELLVAAGLERRGFSWGPQGEDWLDAAQRSRQLRRMATAHTYGFRDCCLAAFDVVLDAVRGDSDETDARVDRALEHGRVATAVAKEVLEHPYDGDVDRLVALATRAANMSGTTSAAGHLVLALVARHGGEPVTGEEHLQRSQGADPDYEPAVHEQVRSHLDRGDLDKVVSLLRRVGSPFSAPVEDLVMDLHGRLTVPFSRAGRNDTCPCGSGRKYKLCCLRQRQLSARDRAALLDLKLTAYVHDAREDDVLLTGITAREPDDVASPVREPLVADLVAFEGGGAREYLDKRGEVLPTEEAALLRAALDEPRRLWQVVAVDEAAQVELHDPDTGRSASIDDPGLASSAELVGTMLLLRIVRVGDVDVPVGSPILVFADERESLRALLATEPTALEIASWHGNR